LSDSVLSYELVTTIFTMPGRLRTSRSTSTSGRSDGTHPTSVESLSFDEYPAVSFPGYAEKPLKDQLEGIAVVGMGESFVKNATWEP